MTKEPIAFEWRDQVLTLGYLGGLRWRIRHVDQVVEASDTDDAARIVLERIFRGATAGQEAIETAPIRVTLEDDVSTFVRDARMVNGWTYCGDDCRFDLGSHEKLQEFVSQAVARRAERAWALGVTPIHPVPVGEAFSFESFAAATDSNAMCARLATVLAARFRESPHPATAFVSAMKELKALGHDLWSWDEDLWGSDYMTKRAGAGLRIQRLTNDERDEPLPEPRLVIEFRQTG